MLIPHADMVGRYCLNKLACHNSSSVYFVFYMTDKQVPIVYPGCFCKKIEAQTAHNLTCAEFYKQRKNELTKIIPHDIARRIFAPYFSALAARSAPGEDASEIPSETVEDLLVRHASKRSRKIGISKRTIMTQHESKRVDRSTRDVQEATMSSFSQVPLPLPAEARDASSVSAIIQNRLGQTLDRAQTPINAYIP